MICKTNISIRQQRRPVEAFTMVEIVLSLSVIAVAMVAIIGVLPLGMNVQSENRERSIVNTDASIWIEAIRGGAQGIEYLPKFVQEVRVVEIRTNISNGSITGPVTNYYSGFTSASNLLGVLGYPKLRWEGTNVLVGRRVYADIRAMNGNMGDLIADNDFAFKYRLTSELVPKVPYAVDPIQNIMQTNLYELRMNFAWPLVIGPGGNYRQQTRFLKDITFRTLVSGNQLAITNELDSTELFHFVNPRHYENQPPVTP